MDEVISFEEAEDFPLPFGQYKGTTIGDIADMDIFYLSWVMEEMKKSPPKKIGSPQYNLYVHLQRYLDDPDVQDEINHIA